MICLRRYSCGVWMLVCVQICEESYAVCLCLLKDMKENTKEEGHPSSLILISLTARKSETAQPV